MHFEKFDLNLLAVLEAVIEERHVTRAAARLHLSQPAVSHALARLRAAVGDPLVLRGPGGMTPTPYALRLLAPVKEALSKLREALALQQDFDPARLSDTLLLGVTDYVELLLLPRVAEEVRKQAPNVRILTQAINQEGLTADLSTGRIDVAIGFMQRAPRGMHAQRLFEEHYVCIARGDWRGRLTLKRYLAARHLQVSPSGVLAGPADEALARQGHKRRVVFATPHFLSGAGIVARTDLLMTTGSRIAEYFARESPLAILKPPFPMPTIEMQMMWHSRTQLDPAQKWLRRLLTGAAENI